MRSKEFFYRLAVAIYKIDNAYDRFAKGSKVKQSTMWVLYALADGKTHTQRSLCEEWQFPRSTLNTIISECRQAGYVDLSKIEGERREMEIRLTEKGREFSDKVLAPVYEAEKKLYSSYYGGEGAQFVKELEKLGDEMERQYSLFDRR